MIHPSFNGQTVKIFVQRSISFYLEAFFCEGCAARRGNCVEFSTDTGCHQKNRHCRLSADEASSPGKASPASAVHARFRHMADHQLMRPAVQARLPLHQSAVHARFTLHQVGHEAQVFAHWFILSLQANLGHLKANKCKRRTFN
jgi:hypothetical protein